MVPLRSFLTRMSSPLGTAQSVHVAKRLGYLSAVGFCTLSFVDNYVVRITPVSGTSMAPTLSPHVHERGDEDLVLITGYTLYGAQETNLRHGDVVVFRKPANPEEHSVKRVVGLPGDTILRDMRRIGMQEENDGAWSKKVGLKPLPPIVKVPEGSVWVEGDNWRVSIDSNTIGPIPITLINGRVRGIVWPPSRFGTVQDTRSGSEKSRTRVIKGRSEDMIDIGFT